MGTKNKKPKRMWLDFRLDLAQAFEEKGIIITNGLVVSKALNEQLDKKNVIAIDAPLILAQIEEEKSVQEATSEVVTDSSVGDGAYDVPAKESNVGDGALYIPLVRF